MKRWFWVMFLVVCVAAGWFFRAERERHREALASIQPVTPADRDWHDQFRKGLETAIDGARRAGLADDGGIKYLRAQFEKQLREFEERIASIDDHRAAILRTNVSMWISWGAGILSVIMLAFHSLRRAP